MTLADGLQLFASYLRFDVPLLSPEEQQHFASLHASRTAQTSQNSGNSSDSSSSSLPTDTKTNTSGVRSMSVLNDGTSSSAVAGAPDTLISASFISNVTPRARSNLPTSTSSSASSSLSSSSGSVSL